MGIRNVPVRPHASWMHAGGPLLVILLLLVLSIAIMLIALPQSRVMPEQQAAPIAGQEGVIAPSARDQWWLDQPAQPTAPARDQWWLER